MATARRPSHSSRCPVVCRAIGMRIGMMDARALARSRHIVRSAVMRRLQSIVTRLFCLARPRAAWTQKSALELSKRVTLITCNLGVFNYGFDQLMRPQCDGSSNSFSPFCLLSGYLDQNKAERISWFVCFASVTIFADEVDRDLNKQFLVLGCTHLKPLSSSMPFRPFAGVDSSFLMLLPSNDGVSLSLSSIVCRGREENSHFVAFRLIISAKVHLITAKRGTYLVALVKFQSAEAGLNGGQWTFLVGWRSAQYIFDHFEAKTSG